jgi:outer membrane protein assembly factor BamD (BamD/ComL family)
MAAKRAGRDEVAIRHLEELLARFPDASLAPNARVERFRALARLGKRDAAAGSARQYLDRHPDGFASAEARSVANGAQPSGPQPK